MLYAVTHHKSLSFGLRTPFYQNQALLTMWTLLLILALVALWFSPSARRSLARWIDPDDRRE